MEAHSTASSSNSSPFHLHQYPQDGKGHKLTQSFHSSLHSVRKSPVKPCKKPIAPLPPTPTRVYKVDPINFRDLVQKLTGAVSDLPQSQQRLQSVAPPPLDLAKPAFFSRDSGAAPLQLLSSPLKTPLSAFYQDLMSETIDAKPNKKVGDSVMASSSLELNLSPSSHSWCSFPLLSPGTISSLAESTVL